jgi:hypothetical protein
LLYFCFWITKKQSGSLKTGKGKMAEEEEDSELTEEEEKFLDGALEEFNLRENYRKIKCRWVAWGVDEEDGEKIFFLTIYRDETQKAYHVIFKKKQKEQLKALRRILDDFIGEDEKEKDSFRAYQ